MRNGFGLQPVFSQEQEMQRGICYDEGYKFVSLCDGAAGTSSQNQGFSVRREFGMPNHQIGMIMKPNPIFGSELANENQYGFTSHSTSMKVIWMFNYLFGTVSLIIETSVNTRFSSISGHKQIILRKRSLVIAP